MAAMGENQMSTEFSTIRQFIGILCLSTGGLLLFFYIQGFGLNLPINDDWDHIRTSLAWKTHGIDSKSLFALHNEHCLAFPRMWNHFWLVATGGDFKTVLFMNAGLAFALLVLLLRFVRDWKLPLPVFFLLNLSLALAVSSWSQWQNLLWAFQAPFFMLPLFVAAAAVLLVHCRCDSVAFPIVIGVVWLSVFTNGNGIFVGWVLLPAILAGNRRRAWTAGYVLNLAFATGVAAWLISSSSSKSLGGIGNILDRPSEVLFAGISVLGSPFVPAEVFQGQNLPAAIAGILALGCAGILIGVLRTVFRTDRLAEAGPGVALGLYGLLSVAAVVYGRSTMLLTAPIESRYQSFALVGIIGLILCAGALAAVSEGRGRVAATTVTVLTAVGLSAGVVVAMPLLAAHGSNMRAALVDQQEILRNAENPDWEPRLGEITSQRAPGKRLEIERLKSDLVQMRQAGILHPDLQP
jgi:hypothetical protein